jgi:hypothetical protein
MEADQAAAKTTLWRAEKGPAGIISLSDLTFKLDTESPS